MKQLASGEFGLHLGGSEEVKCEVAEWNQQIPPIAWKVRRWASSHCDEVVFEIPHSSLSWIGAMIIWCYLLVCQVGFFVEVTHEKL